MKTAKQLNQLTKASEVEYAQLLSIVEKAMIGVAKSGGYQYTTSKLDPKIRSKIQVLLHDNGFRFVPNENGTLTILWDVLK